jgi:hypothetical protein
MFNNIPSKIPSIHYITWNIAENSATSGTNLYLSIYKSQVQVYSSIAVPIIPSTAPTVLNTGISLPVTLSISPYYTYSSLIITPTLNSLNIFFSPSVITFSSGSNTNSVNTLGFKIVTANATSGFYSIALSLSGTDAVAYSFI